MRAAFAGSVKGEFDAPVPAEGSDSELSHSVTRAGIQLHKQVLVTSN